ncbi:MAG: NAD(P)H-dependent glycerol-3-phosphate dehydrogenase [Gammaproteobacteria bacterium]
MEKTPIAVLGAGSWGTALAILLAKNNTPTRLWGRDPVQLQQMTEARCNQRYLPDIELPETLTLYTDLEAAVADIEDILIVVPSHTFADLISQLSTCIAPETRIAWGTKGLDNKTGRLLQTVVEDTLGKERALAVISGPSFALEVAKGLPTAVTLASNATNFAHNLLARLHNDHFRVYLNEDLLGVQLCGAIKNILAIATGITDAFALGANARAALITRGLAEMTRLGSAMGANPATFMGLAGVGDLVLTCTGDLSRNRRFGILLGQGTSSKKAQRTIGQAIEGIYNAQQIINLAQQYLIDMPISQQVLAILEGKHTPQRAVQNLLSRAPTPE